MKQTLLIIILLSVIFTSSDGTAQINNEEEAIEVLCQRWNIDSLEMDFFDYGKQAAPDNIKDNYLSFKKDGTFQSREGPIELNGLWKLDFDEMKVIVSDIDHPDLTEDIVFNIVELSKVQLAIKSKPLSGGHVTMFYHPAEE